MSEGSIEWDDEDDKKNKDVKGILPDGDYEDYDTTIYYCCRNQGNWYDPVELPVSVSFFLLPYKTKNCQRVKWAMSHLQYIKYHTENNQNRDAFKDSHVYTENKNSPYTLRTVYYCYYEGMCNILCIRVDKQSHGFARNQCSCMYLEIFELNLSAQ